jgi:hypothetical protein
MLERDVHMIAPDELHAKHDDGHADQRRPGARYPGSRAASLGRMT